MARPATRGAGGEPNSTSDASQRGLVPKGSSRSIAPRRGAPSPHRIEIRTAAGPSSVVQWVLSGGPYTVSSHTRHTSRWCDHPGNCMADGLQASAGRDPVTGRTMRRGDHHPLPWTRGLASAESRGRGCSHRRGGYGRHGRRRRRRRGGRCARRRLGNDANGARAGLLVSDGNTNRSHGDYGAGTNDGR
jgi:hypothetical protein